MQRKFTFKQLAGLRKVMAIMSSLLVCMILTGNVVQAQTAGSYTFAQSGGTFTPITGGTVINTTIPDSWQSGAIPLAPGFFFCGTFYTTMWVTSNGVIGLGGTAGPGTTIYNGISTNGAGSGINLCPFGADQIGSSATGAAPEIRYQFINNEHIIQWKDISRYPATTDRMSYQARLNAVTGTITYVYSITSVGTSTSYQPAIGIRTATTAGNWQSRLVSTAGAETWATSLLAANTTDLLRFTTATANPKQPVSGQTYVWTPPTAPPNCSSLTFPATSTTVASPGTVCVSGNVNLSLGTVIPSGGAGITYVWQFSPNNAAPWTSMDTTYGPTYTTTAAYLVNSSRYFRCLVRCNTTTMLTTTSQQVVVNTPGTPTVTPGSRCGPGSINLGATPPAGSVINWYQNASGGGPLGSGTTYNTGYLPTTTTFYAAAASGTTPATQWVGTGTTTTTSPPNPYYTTWYGNKEQFLIKASELIAAGLSAGTINNIGFNVQASSGAPALSQYRIAMANTVVNNLTTTFEPVSATVLNPTTYTIVPNTINTHVLDNPFYWDGSSNLLIEVCFNNSTWSGSTSISYSSYSYNTSHYDYYDNTNQCAAPSGIYNYVGTTRPNIQFGMTLSCVGPRVPVTATITPPPAVVKTAPAVVCNNAVTPITVASSPMSNYTNYAWTPVTTNLYTTAAATTPYTTGNAPTVYMKSNVVGTNTYYMFASGATPAACTFADTVKIWVQPDTVSIKAFPDTICAPSGTTMLKLVPNTGYAPNSIQWMQSTTGLPGSYTPIASATGVTYNTPALSANRWYKVIIGGTHDTCQAPVKKIVVTDPQLTSWADSFNCGPGSVVLQAQSAGNSNVRWYSSASANLPIGSGSPWTTPYQAATTTYYVGAGTGTVEPPPTNVVVTGTQSTGSPSSFLYYYYKGAKSQHIITAAQMIAQGYGPGLITALGIQTGSVGNTTMNNVSIELGSTAATTLTAFQSGLQPVYTAASYTLTANAVNTFTFQDPFFWDGVSNIIVGMCRINNATNTSVNNYVYRTSGSCVYRYGDATDMCSAGVGMPTGGTAYGPYTTTNTPHTIFTMLGGCESPRQMITAYIRPVPEVDLGADINECVDAGAVKVLDAGVQYNIPKFLWDNGDSSQVRAVTQSGTYSVRVTNQYTCHNEDTIVVLLRRNPVVNLGHDTTVCNGVVLPLNAGSDGIDYFWSTGQTTQMINVSAAGSYNVFVTNNQGCVKTDTIVVNMAGELPSVQGINVSNNGINTFHFTAVNPQNVIGYDWDFGDNTAHSYQAAPSHTYANAGNYIVVLHLSSSCGFLTDSSSAHIVGIHQLNVGNDELTVYPNPAKETATILNKGALKMESVSVYNILGQVVYKATADSNDKHTLQLNGFASGVYTIQVFTDKGNVARKLEIVR